MRTLCATRRTTAVVGSLLLGGLWACRDKAPDPAPDPCLGQKANPLTFRFLERFGTPTPDSAYAKQDIGFEAPGAPYTSYHWTIGSDPRSFTERKFSLYFYEGNAGPLVVRLIATRPKNTACFPKDDGVDTLTRVLTLLPTSFPRPAPILGYFRGANTDSPQDTFTVKVFKAPDYAYNNDPAYPWATYLRNLSKGCHSPYLTVGQSWRAIDVYGREGGFGCNYESGRGYLTTRDSVRVEYSRNESANSTTRKSHVFLGRRVR